MSAQLVSLTEGPSIVLDKPVLLVGRDPECDVQIESRKISRRHCCIAQVNDYLVVRDLGSTNGVRINGVRVVEGRLKEDDELTIGAHRFRVSWAVEEPAAAKAGPKAVRPRPVVADADLESFDEPVPLAEPPARTPGADAGRGKRNGPPPGPPRRKPIIPEGLDLAPASELDMDTGNSNP